MASKLSDAIQKNRAAAEDLDRALREMVRDMRDRPETVVEGRLRVIQGGRTSRSA